MWSSHEGLLFLFISKLRPSLGEQWGIPEVALEDPLSGPPSLTLYHFGIVILSAAFELSQLAIVSLKLGIIPKPFV